ncbi:MAG: hypothetical protein ACI9S8_000933 [Chlamydiales bacterium]|jgi:hypothetical protein
MDEVSGATNPRSNKGGALTGVERKRAVAAITEDDKTARLLKRFEAKRDRATGDSANVSDSAKEKFGES